MSKRLEVLKTYKLYIGGKFVRSESGRYYNPTNAKGENLGNICLASRKDFRNSVVVARKAQASWANRSAYNVGQILYRIAENLEGRKQEMTNIVVKEEGVSSQIASNLIEQCIDRLIYFAGWSDKFQQLYSSVNPVASSHFNFSIVEPTGVVGVLCAKDSKLISLISSIAALICGGNSIVILADEEAPLSAIVFAEVLQHSDVPAGLVNILTGKIDELYPHFASHMDVNALLTIDLSKSIRKEIDETASVNVKRVLHQESKTFESNDSESPQTIRDFLEVKTTWHPIEQIGGAQAGY